MVLFTRPKTSGSPCEKQNSMIQLKVLTLIIISNTAYLIIVPTSFALLFTAILLRLILNEDASAINNISNTAYLIVPTLSLGFVETIVSMTCMLSWDIAYHSMYIRYVQLIQIRLPTKLNKLHDAMSKSSLVLRLKKKSLGGTWGQGS